jgi:hypothetical protein
VYQKELTKEVMATHQAIVNLANDVGALTNRVSVLESIMDHFGSEMEHVRNDTKAIIASKSFLLIFSVPL